MAESGSDEYVVLTLTQLAQMALGGKNMQQFNIQSLLSLIGILIRKVDAQDEKLRIEGREAAPIIEIMQLDRQIEPLPFFDAYSDDYWHMFRRIDNATKSIERSEKILYYHFRDVKRRNTPVFNEYDYALWEPYARINEDLFELFDEPLYKVIASVDFAHKTKRRAATSIDRAMEELAERMKDMADDFCDFYDRMEVKMQPVELVPTLIGVVKHIDDLMEEREQRFRKAIKEIKEQITIKLDKRHLPVMKKYYTERLERIAEGIRSLHTTGCETFTSFPQGDTDICLSCLSRLPSSPEFGLPTQFTSRMPLFKSSANKLPECTCQRQHAIDVMATQNTAQAAETVQHFESTQQGDRAAQDNLTVASFSSDDLRLGECHRSVKHVCKGEFALKRCDQIIHLSEPQKRKPQNIVTMPCGSQPQSPSNDMHEFVCPQATMSRFPQRTVTSQICNSHEKPQYCGQSCTLRYFRSILCLKTVKCNSVHQRDEFVLPEHLRDYGTDRKRTCKIGHAMTKVQNVCPGTRTCMRQEFAKSHSC